MKLSQPIITREHGSWAVLFVPMIVGISYADNATLNNLWLACSALGVFMSYIPVHTMMRELGGQPQGKEKLYASELWGSIYLLVGFFSILPLFLQGYLHLITFAMLGSAAFFGNFFLTRSGNKSIVSDLTAVAGLTLSAPSAYYIAVGSLDIHAFVLWMLNFLFFGSSVFYVHMKISVVSLKKEHLQFSERMSLGRLNIVYHIIIISIVVVMSLYNLTQLTVSLAFIPMIVHAVIGTVKLSSKVKFKKLGYLLLAQSIFFGLALSIIWS
jgi:hypothetical protein